MTTVKLGRQGPKACFGLLGAASIAALAGLSSAPSVSASGGWVTTNTKAKSLSGAVSLGSLAPTGSLHVLVGLQMHNASQIQPLVQAMANPQSPSYHQFLTPAQFTAQFAPTSSEVASVVSYLNSEGFKNVKVAPNNLYVEADGLVGTIQSAFNTQLMSYTLNGENLFANVADVQVPSALGGIVSSVIGLQNATKMHTFLGRPTAGTQSGNMPVGVASQQIPAMGVNMPQVAPSFDPQDFWKAYDVGTVPAASTTTIAIFTWGSMTQDVKDLAQFESEKGLPKVPVDVIHVGTGTSTETDGDGEWDMDMAISTGMAGDVKQLRIYNADGGYDVNLIPAFNRFVTDDVASAGSASFGACEYTEILDGALQLYDQIFAQAATQGQTVFASAGDSGSACYLTGAGALNGVPLTGAPDTNYPASSPYVMAAGGTSLFVDAGYDYLVETCWDAGGGGPAIFEFSPNWQQPYLPGYTFTEAQQAYKGVPDIAMDADFLLSAANYVLDGADTSNGGTSLASPLSLGSWARLENVHSNMLGHAGPVLYALGTPGGRFNAVTGSTLAPVDGTVDNLGVLSSDVGFHDIDLGTNGLYQALPGWDFTTGLGSFDISAMAPLVGPESIGSFPVLDGLI